MATKDKESPDSISKASTHACGVGIYFHFILPSIISWTENLNLDRSKAHILESTPAGSCPESCKCCIAFVVEIWSQLGGTIVGPCQYNFNSGAEARQTKPPPHNGLHRTPKICHRP